MKDVGLILSEELERERRDSVNKYWLAQWDESAMRKRKYNKYYISSLYVLNNNILLIVVEGESFRNQAQGIRHKEAS